MSLSSQELRGHVFSLKFVMKSCLCARWRSDIEDNLEADEVELHNIQISRDNPSEFMTPNEVSSEFWTANDTSDEVMAKPEEIIDTGNLVVDTQNAPRDTVSTERFPFQRNCSISAEIALFRPKSNTL